MIIVNNEAGHWGMSKTRLATREEIIKTGGKPVDCITFNYLIL